MRTKTTTKLALSACLLLVGLLLHTQASAQQAAKSTARTNVPQSNQPARMAGETNALTPDAGATDERGTVQVREIDDNGSVQTKSVGKPSVNTAVEMNSADAQAFEAGFIQWMKANPNFASYLNSHELSLVQANDFETLYKQSYHHTLKRNQQAK